MYGSYEIYRSSSDEVKVGAEAAIRSSFLIPVVCFAVVLVYSLVFRAKKEA